MDLPWFLFSSVTIFGFLVRYSQSRFPRQSNLHKMVQILIADTFLQCLTSPHHEQLQVQEDDDDVVVVVVDDEDDEGSVLV